MTLRYRFTSLESGTELLLPVGVKKCKIYTQNVSVIVTELGLITPSSVTTATHIEFPIINGKSPSKFTVSSVSGNGTPVLEILIEELGGAPDPDYFDLTGLQE